MEIFKKPLFIFEMANNHQGSVNHGKNIISALRQASKPYMDSFNFAVKFQYRNLKTFIHKDYYDRADIKNVKRFRDTELNGEQFAELKHEAEVQGFFTICTPFDEDSVGLIKEHGYDAIKIASCSFTDWPLLERAAECGIPVIASAAGAPLPDIRKTVNFFKNRKIDLSLMHCVAEYPTACENLQMNQIDLYRAEFPGIRVGFSTHERPDDMEPVKAAVAKGAAIFEKHVGLRTGEIGLNEYSASPEQVSGWLRAASDTYKLCGLEGERYLPSSKETDALTALKRGVFAGRRLNCGEKISPGDLYLAFPSQPGQLLASHLSKYNTFKITQSEIAQDAPIMLPDIEIIDDTARIQRIIADVLDLIHKSGVVVPANSTCEISHHYGLDKFSEVGVTIINCINREYCKKILVVFPGQRNPEHTHIQKEETFTVLYGELLITCGNVTQTVGRGESITIERGVAHKFQSDIGCVFEEISTTHNKNDSFYGPEESGFVSPRKTEIYITREILGGC